MRAFGCEPVVVLLPAPAHKRGELGAPDFPLPAAWPRDLPGRPCLVCGHHLCPCQPGGFYLAAVMDWATQHVLSWRLSNTMDASFCLRALDAARIIGSWIDFYRCARIRRWVGERQTRRTAMARGRHEQRASCPAAWYRAPPRAVEPATRRPKAQHAIHRLRVLFPTGAEIHVMKNPEGSYTQSESTLTLPRTAQRSRTTSTVSNL